MNSHLRHANACSSFPLFPEYWVHVGGHEFLTASLSLFVTINLCIASVSGRGYLRPSRLTEKITMALVLRARRYCVKLKPIASPFPCACRRSLLARDYFLEGAERRERSPNIRGLHAVLGSPTKSVYSLSPPPFHSHPPSPPTPPPPHLFPSALTLTLAPL